MNEMSKNKIMMLIFVASESFFFLALIISYIYYSRPEGILSETAKYLDIVKTSVFTIFLLSSSITIELADNQLKKGNRKTMLMWLLISILFGLIFLVGQGTEYAGLISEKVTISRNIFGSAFFTLTGFHGLIALGVMAGLIASKKYEQVEQDAFKTTTIYWHFVDAVWVAVFTVVYIGSVL